MVVVVVVVGKMDGREKCICAYVNEAVDDCGAVGVGIWIIFDSQPLLMFEAKQTFGESLNAKVISAANISEDSA